MMQTYWSDNAVSTAVYYKSEELGHDQAWLPKTTMTASKSISFLLQ